MGEAVTVLRKILCLVEIQYLLYLGELRKASFSREKLRKTSYKREGWKHVIIPFQFCKKADAHHCAM